jgi:ubiquinol-cytochrome c reductase cytochrome c1 subunit
MWKLILGLFLCYPILLLGEEISPAISPKKHIPLATRDLASLQRGAKYFMNFCSGCHSLQFMRYTRLGIDLKITNKADPIASNQRLSKNFIFTQANPNDTIKSNLYKKDALLWFGQYPPELSLTVRAKGVDWVYNYLLGFFPDNTRPFGVNNSLIKNTAMPDPFAILRQQLSSNHLTKSKINTGDLNKQTINSNNYKTFTLETIVTDLVNFLAYTAEPIKTERRFLGIKVCGFLLLLSCAVYFLKKQIWRDIK